MRVAVLTIVERRYMFTSRLVAFSASILFLSSLTRASHGQELPNVKDCIRAQDEGMPLNNRLKTQAQACRAASKGLREQAANLRKESVGVGELSTPSKVAGSSAASEATGVAGAAAKADESATVKATALADSLDNAAVATDNQAKQVEDQNPYLPLGNWSLSYTAFVGLLRVTMKSKPGTADTFEPLSGAGMGMKFSYNGLDNSGKRMELFGAGAGFYFEPKIKVSGQDATAQALSAILVVSGLSKFYVGLTYKFVSNEPAFSRGNGAENVGFVFGGGFDGSML
jgi:hypothetical protein